MSVECPYCGSLDVTLETKVEVKFKFDKNGDVNLLTDVADAVYWDVEYNDSPTECQCSNCGCNFEYRRKKALTLKDLTELVANNSECVILKVKEGHEIDLIALGVFSGHEKMFRLTKGKSVTCTVFSDNGKNFSREWSNGYTLVSNSVRKMGQIIQNCIEQDYGIKCQFKKGSVNNLKKMLAKYAGFKFQSSSSETSEFKTFCAKLKKAMQKDIREKFSDLELSVWLKGHFYISGFITRKSDSAIFYFNLGDVRCSDVTGQQMYRSARHLKDYHGGTNKYCKCENLLETIAKERYEFTGLEELRK